MPARRWRVEPLTRWSVLRADLRALPDRGGAYRATVIGIVGEVVKGLHEDPWAMLQGEPMEGHTDVALRGAYRAKFDVPVGLRRAHGDMRREAPGYRVVCVVVARTRRVVVVAIGAKDPEGDFGVHQPGVYEVAARRLRARKEEVSGR